MLSPATAGAGARAPFRGDAKGRPPTHSSVAPAGAAPSGRGDEGRHGIRDAVRPLALRGDRSTASLVVRSG